MDYRALSHEQREAMLRAVGFSRVEELFADLPSEVLLDGPLADVGDGMGEMELVSHVSSLAGANEPAGSAVSFMGAGAYDHYTPSIVDHVLRRPEVFTAYTPYQPEVSQGTLQAIFEFQTAVCELTGMEVSNAGMYDGATALVEAALMAARLTKRVGVLAASTIHPEWLQTLATYAHAGVLEVTVVDPSALVSTVDSTHAAVLVSDPDFLGRLHDLVPIVEAAHAVGAMSVVAVNPLLQSILEPPATYGADIVVGEGQPLGLPMSFGGPGIGLFACRQSHVRQMPGRIVGRAFDQDGTPGFVLTLSTREQHIRREKATSNICSNQALCATAIGVYVAATGAVGLPRTAELCVARAHYLRDGLVATGAFVPVDDAPFGYEFALRYTGDVDEYFSAMRDLGILPGVRAVELSEDYDDDIVVFAVTEKRNRHEIDFFVKEVGEL